MADSSDDDCPIIRKRQRTLISEDDDDRPIIFKRRSILKSMEKCTYISSMEKRTAMLMDLDVTDCPVCFEALTIPILQCNNGHITCSTCCEKLKNICATCSLPIESRNRAMERVLELLKVSCPNAESGCLENIFFDKVSTHLDQCAFTKLPCPFSHCNFIGLYEDFYEHCVAKHCMSSYMFKCGEPLFLNPKNGERTILKEQTIEGRGELVVLECFYLSQDRIFYASCIGPGTENFSYSLKIDSSSSLRDRLCFESHLERVREERSELLPKKHFLKVPSYMCPYNFKISVCINRET